MLSSIAMTSVQRLHVDDIGSPKQSCNSFNNHCSKQNEINYSLSSPPAHKSQRILDATFSFSTCRV